MAKQNNNKDSGKPLSTKALEKKAAILKEINESLGFESNFQRGIANTEAERLAATREIEKLETKLNRHVSGRQKLGATALSNLKAQIVAAKQYDKALENQVKRYKEQQSVIEKMSSKLKQFGDSNFGFGAIAGYLMQSDKAIKHLTLELGLSGDKADQLRSNLSDAATYAAKLGVSIDDLSKAQASFSDETARTAALTAQEYKNITNIGKGTALGVEQAGKLAAQFDLLGVSIQSSEKFVQGVVDSSERLGINASKVLKNISQNFKTLNTFSFKDGIKGMAKMTEYSEKFKLDLNDSINSAKMAKSLEGAIEMASQLNVLGGEFAKTDPFELLFLSRNDPAKYAKKLTELTKGMATLQKTEDGFQFDITAQDQDRLRQAADALGVSYENLAESARKVAQVQQIKKETLGLNLSKEEKEYIEGISKFDDKSGKFYAMINGVKKNLAQLSTSDIKAMKQQEKTLEARAQDSQTFDEVFKNTILEMKSVLLPVLQGVNFILKGLTKFRDSFGETGVKIAGGFLIAATTLGGAFKLGKTVLSGAAGLLSKLASAGSGAIGSGGGIASAGKTGGGVAGGGSAKSIAAVGVAAAGIGAGVGAAALGISKLAEAFKELDPKQIDGLNKALLTMGITFGTVFVAGLVAISVAGPAATVPLLALGAAALGIGAGIGIAAAGIGYMAKGLSELTKNADGQQLLGIAGGLAAIGASMLTLAGGGILGVIGGGGALGMILAIASQASAIQKVGDAFKNMGVVLNANADQFERVEQAVMNIANAKIDSNGIFSELKDLLSKPIKVEFADKSVQIKSDITLEINRERLVKMLDIGREAIVQTVRQQQGSGSARSL